MTPRDLELIKHLAASNAQNDIEDISLGLRTLAQRHNWTIQEATDVAEFILDQRKKIIEATVEGVRIALSITLGSKE